MIKKLLFIKYVYSIRDNLVQHMFLIFDTLQIFIYKFM